MLTISDAEEQRATCIRKYDNHRTKMEFRLQPDEVSRLKSRMKLLEKVRNYLETSPSERFVKDEKKRLTAELKKIEGGFDSWKEAGGNNPIIEDCRTEEEKDKALRKEWKRLNEWELKKKQIKVLTFILNG